jgi:hypothetical protein
MKTQKTDFLVPIDFKLFSLKSIDYAKNLLNDLKGTIHLIHVIESESWWSSYFNEKEIIQQASEKLEMLKKEQNLPDKTIIKVVIGKS